MTAGTGEMEAPKPENTIPDSKIETVGEPVAAEITQDEELPEKSKENVDVEAGSIAESVKGYYSKLSVWLMVLFSGLAIGSDG